MASDDVKDTQYVVLEGARLRISFGACGGDKCTRPSSSRPRRCTTNMRRRR